MFLIIGLTIIGAFLPAQVVNGLSYQSELGVQFEFEPLLAVALSSDALMIDSLSPGNSASSNMITISVNTNGLAGYTLSAAVGDGTTYTDNSLTNLASQANPKPVFSSIPVGSAGVVDITSDNTWGYTLDATNYYGLAYIHSMNNQEETWTVINATKDTAGTAYSAGYAGTANTNFAIRAKASATQMSGDYTNVIQFKVISNPVPSAYSIVYNQNSADTVTGMPADVNTTYTDGLVVSLSNDAPVRAGYTFNGWCTAQVSEGVACTGESYSPGADVSLTSGQLTAIVLYAMWNN